MTYKTIPSSGQFGYIADAAPQELPANAWSYARNIRFRDGYAERFAGSGQVFTTPSVTPYWIAPFRNGNSKFWIHAGIARVYVDDGTTRTDLTPASTYTGAIDDRWTGGSASGVMVINNGIDQPQFWAGNPAVKFANLTAWDANWRCACLRPFKQYLVALDITKSGTRYPHMVKWSAAAVPGAVPSSWNEADPTKDAGEQDLAETTDFLVDQLPLGDLNVIYKERSMYGMQYIGQPFIWRFFRLPGEVGMLARGCVANTPKGHVVLTSGDLVVHSGQGPESIITGRMKKWLFNQIDATNYRRAFVFASYLTNECWVCFPESGQSACTLALVWNWQEDTFTTRQLQNATYGAAGPVVSSSAIWSTETRTWNTDTRTWGNESLASTQSRVLLSTTAPLITMTEAAQTFDGTSPTVTLERTGITLDAPDTVKTVRSIIPRIDAVAGTQVSIQVGGSMDAEVAPTWSTPITYTVGTTRKADAFAAGRFLAFRITGTTTNQWRLRSFDMDIRGSGAY
jgi:hypothetical protein